MALSVRPLTRLDLALVALAVLVLAVLATLVFTGPGSSPNFGLTTDPASGLWSW